MVQENNIRNIKDSQGNLYDSLMVIAFGILILLLIFVILKAFIMVFMVFPLFKIFY